MEKPFIINLVVNRIFKPNGGKIHVAQIWIFNRLPVKDHADRMHVAHVMICNTTMGVYRYMYYQGMKLKYTELNYFKPYNNTY